MYSISLTIFSSVQPCSRKYWIKRKISPPVISTIPFTYLLFIHGSRRVDFDFFLPERNLFHFREPRGVLFRLAPLFGGLFHFRSPRRFIVHKANQNANVCPLQGTKKFIKFFCACILSWLVLFHSEAVGRGTGYRIVLRG